jgi:tRNA(Ile)-lysidine synthase
MQEREIHEYMQSLGLEVYFFKKEIPKIARKLKKTLEETGRFVRYAILQSIAREKNLLVLTAHHSLDYLESVLIHMIRGGGKASLHTLEILQKNVFRPLLLFHYSEIQEILSTENWKIFEDESNQDQTYLRNRIRKQLIPFLLQEGLNPDKLYQNFHEGEYFLQENNPKTTSPSYVKIYLLGKETLSQLKQILDAYLKLLGLSPSNYKLLFELKKQLEKSSVVCVENKEAIFWKAKKPILYIISKKSRALQKPILREQHIHWNGKKYLLEDETLCEDRKGKKMQFKYGKKEVSEIFREKNIPSVVRENLPILEKNGFITKILFSMWDEELKDLSNA